MTLHVKQEYFFHDPDSTRFFSRNGGFFVIRCITPPDVKNVRIEQAGSRKKRMISNSGPEITISLNL